MNRTCSTWIKCSDQLPKEYEEVLCLASMNENWHNVEDIKHNQNKQFVGYYNGDSWQCVYGDGYVPFHFEEVYHWMPLLPIPYDIK